MPKPARDDVVRAFSRRCHFTCRACGRPCTAALSYNHRFDCCGTVVAHVMGPGLTLQLITEPIRAGYLAGTTSTRAVND